MSYLTPRLAKVSLSIVYKANNFLRYKKLFKEKGEWRIE